MKKLIYLTIILLVVGIWLGINFAKDQPYFSNPFADKDIADKAQATAESVTKKAGEVVDKVFKEQ